MLRDLLILTGNPARGGNSGETNMLKRLRSGIPPLFLGFLAAILPAAAEETPPAACPANVEKLMVERLVPLQNGQTDGLNAAYAMANAARGQCADNSLALTLSVEMLTRIAVVLSQSGSPDADTVWKEAYTAAMEQDAAPVHADVALSWETGPEITLTDAQARATADSLLEANIAPVIAGYAMSAGNFGDSLEVPLTDCPYLAAGQQRAVLEAKGLVKGITENASAYAEPDSVLARLETLRKTCTAQAPALTEQTIRAYVEFADMLDRDDNTARLATCMADDAVSRIAEYRDLVRDKLDDPTTAVLAKMTVWQNRLQTHHTLSCQR